MIEGLQEFRDSDGNIICVKVGWIAVEIPADRNVRAAHIVGTSIHEYYDNELSYYDVALDGMVVLHIFRRIIYGSIKFGAFKPYFFEEYPC